MDLSNTSTYDDFEPYCKWERNEAQDVLIMHLPDFKRNELKIQINKFNVLTISGESQPAKSVSKISRFTKRIRISNEYYDEDQISAKFVSGILYITMPHRVPRSKTESMKNEAVARVCDKKKAMETHPMCKEMSYGFGAIKGLILEGNKGQTVALVATAVAVSSLGAYAVYRLLSSSNKT